MKTIIKKIFGLAAVFIPQHKISLIALDFFKDFMFRHIQYGNFREKLIDRINARVDIPHLSEAQEKVLISTMLTCLVEAFTDWVNEKRAD